MGRMSYYHVNDAALHRLPPRLREWELHTITPDEADRRYGVIVKTTDDETRLPTFITWLPAFKGVIGHAYGCFVFRFPEGAWLTEEQWNRSLWQWWQQERLTRAALWAVAKKHKNPALDP